MNLSEIENAVVELPDEGGRGVFIAGGFVLTAAHCIPGYSKNEKEQIGNQLVKVNLKGEIAFLQVYYFDKQNDIAILGKIINTIEAANDILETYITCTKALDINNYPYSIFRPFKLKIYNKDKTWVEGLGRTKSIPPKSLDIFPSGAIISGASGGPIINENSEIISIVSAFSPSNENGEIIGVVPLLSSTLPPWILNPNAPAGERL